jgi:hypothetical protein
LTIKRLLLIALVRQYKAPWIFHKAESLGLEIYLIDLMLICKAYKFHPNWVGHKARELNVQPRSKTFPNNYFNLAYENHYEIKKALIDWRIKLHDNAPELLRLEDDYYEFLSKSFN